jgi:hypothetical protein
MLPDFRSWELSQTRELVHRGFGDAQEPRHLRDSQNLAIRGRSTVDIEFGCCCDDIVHDG